MWFVLLIAVNSSQDPVGFRDLLRVQGTDIVRGRQAIVDFERHRRHLLPSEHASAGRCDEPMGRFCYWYDDADTVLPKEPKSIRGTRTRLLETLQALHDTNPTSDWFVGQRVRYLIEQGAIDSATRVVTRCQATRWWCHALQGLVDHVARRFDQADAAFRLATDSMPAEWACQWNDWRAALSSAHRDRLSPLACDQRAAAMDSLFWLAQPLLGRPGNDLRTEFHSRRVMSLLHASSISPHLNTWGDDLEEMMIRYGWSTHWSVAEPRLSTLEPPSVIGHQRVPAYDFFPTWSESDTTWQWTLDPTTPRSRYGPSYLDHLTEAAQYQIARFPRGDSTVVVAAMVVKADTGFAAGPFDVWLAASAGSGGPVTVASGYSLPALGPVLVRLLGAPALLSLEASRPSGRRFARARVWFAPPRDSSGLALSDPLLFRVHDDLPINLEAAAIHALPSGSVSRREPVGVYWEASGPGADSVDIAVAVIPIRRGLLGRLGERLSLVKRRAPLTLQWRTGGEAGAVVGRAFELDLRRLKPGRYYLRLEATGRGQTKSTGRAFELTS